MVPHIYLIKYLRNDDHFCAHDGGFDDRDIIAAAAIVIFVLVLALFFLWLFVSVVHSLVKVVSFDEVCESPLDSGPGDRELLPALAPAAGTQKGARRAVRPQVLHVPEETKKK